MRYAVVIEKGPTSWGAYVPDLPGCVAAARTRAKVEQLIQEAIEFHLEGIEDEQSRRPRSRVQYVDVSVPRKRNHPSAAAHA